MMMMDDGNVTTTVTTAHKTIPTIGKISMASNNNNTVVEESNSGSLIVAKSQQNNITAGIVACINSNKFSTTERGETTNTPENITVEPTPTTTAYNDECDGNEKQNNNGTIPVKNKNITIIQKYSSAAKILFTTLLLLL